MKLFRFLFVSLFMAVVFSACQNSGDSHGQSADSREAEEHARYADGEELISHHP